MKMTVVTYETRVPTLEEFVELRSNAGWRMPPEPMMRESLGKTLFGVCAQTSEGQTIGMARVVGDGGLQVFVTDVVVHADWQNRGIGSCLMARVMEHTRATTAAGAFVGLFSARGREEFYERFGFIVRPNETMGAGMVFRRDS